MLSAPLTFGIREMIPKLSLAISTLPRAKSLRIYRIGPLRIPQNFLKKITGRPSGPGAESGFMDNSTSLSSSVSRLRPLAKTDMDSNDLGFNL
jgi:hypothetical protein